MFISSSILIFEFLTERHFHFLIDLILIMILIIKSHKNSRHRYVFFFSTYPLTLFFPHWSFIIFFCNALHYAAELILNPSVVLGLALVRYQHLRAVNTLTRHRVSHTFSISHKGKYCKHVWSEVNLPFSVIVIDFTAAFDVIRWPAIV